MHAHSTSSVSHTGSFLKTVGGVRVDHELVSRQEAMHAHGTFSVSHPGSFLKTLGGMRVDRELVRSRWQLSTVHDGRLSAVQGSRARSDVKIEDREEHEEEQEEECEKREEHEEHE